MAAEARAACAAAPAAKRDYARALDQARDTRAHLERTYAALLAEESEARRKIQSVDALLAQTAAAGGNKDAAKAVREAAERRAEVASSGRRYAKTERGLSGSVNTPIYTRAFSLTDERTERTTDDDAPTPPCENLRVRADATLRQLSSRPICHLDNYGGLTSSLPWARPTRLVR